MLEDLHKGTYKRRLVDSSTLNINARGVIKKPCESIKFQGANIITPDGNDMINDVSVTIEPGMHCFIHGPNGSGKSSLFRVLAELWPLFSGVMEKPNAQDIFYVAQNPYCPKGTLRD